MPCSQCLHALGTYDTLNRLKTRKDALLRTETYDYDIAGRLKQVTDRKAQVSGFGYDALNRRTSAGFGATTGNPTAFTSTIAYTWDAGNRLTQAVDSVSGTITRQYDTRFDTLTQEITPEGQVNLTYDAAARRATFQVAGQTQLGYTFDVADRLTQIAQGATTVGFGYDNANRRTTLTLPNGIVVEYGYDNANQLTGLTYKNGGTTLGALTYTYDNAGRRTQVAGSYARTNLPTAVASATYNVNNQLTNWGGATLTYDNNGNLLTDGTNTHVWNARDQLASISGGVTASFGYDAFNRRRTKTIAGTKTDFLYDGLNFVQEKDGATVKANLFTGLGIDEVFRRTQGATTSDVLPDALGSSVALSDSTKAITTQYTYAPYGTTTQTGPANDNSQRFTGREDDGTTGLYYYRTRYYSPKFSRFAAEDLIDFRGGPNLYAYVGDSPTSKLDPLGYAGVGSFPTRPERIPRADRHGPRFPYSFCGPEGDPNNYPSNFGFGDFNDACFKHDACYSRCGENKYFCDLVFWWDIASSPHETWGGSGYAMYPYQAVVATAYSGIVFVAGGQPYSKAQAESCSCKGN